MPNYPLTDEQIEQYRVEGFVVIESALSTDKLLEIDRVIRELAKQALASGEYSDLMEIEPESQAAGDPVPRRIYNPYEQHEAFRGLANDDCILDRVESLIGSDIGLQHSKLNMKPAKVGSVVEWHQDLSYFPHTNDDLVTTLIYLDDATEENGCLQVLPRHHSHFFDHHLPDGMFAGMVTEEIGDGRFGRPAALAAPAGSVIFMHCMLPHSSLPNRSDKGRRTLIFEYRAADSFPLLIKGYASDLELMTHHLRGKPARFARFGGPPPMIPNMPLKPKSLYQLQERSKAEQQSATAR